MKRLFLCAMIAVFAASFAEAVSFEDEHVYRKKEADTKESCSLIARERAKRAVFGKVAGALRNDPGVRRAGLAGDQFAVLAVVLFRHEIVSETMDDDACLVRMKVDADMGRAAQAMESCGRERDLPGDAEKAAKRAEEAMHRLDTLRVMLSYLRDRPDAVLLAQFRAAVDALRAVDWFEQGLSAFIVRDHQAAVEAFGRAVALSPDVADAHYYRGRVNMAVRNFDAATNDLDRAAELLADDLSDEASLFVYRGTAHMHLGNYQAAQGDFERAIELNPEDSLVYSHRGGLFLQQREYQKAITDFMRAVQLDPKNADAYAGWGMAFFQMEEYQKAVRELDRAIRLAPDSVGAYQTRAQAYAGLDNHRLAVADFSRALDLDPENAAIRYQRGKAFMALGDYQDAVTDFDVIIEKAPQEMDVYYYRGEALIALGRAQLALLDFDRAIERNGDDARVLRRRGFLLLYEMNDERRGCADWSRACSLGECEDYHRAREKGYCRR